MNTAAFELMVTVTVVVVVVEAGAARAITGIAVNISMIAAIEVNPCRSNFTITPPAQVAKAPYKGFASSSRYILIIDKAESAFHK